MHSWQFAKAQHLAEKHGWTRFVSMQNHYNLLYREEEREMVPLCRDQAVGLIPWSPLARGHLARATEAKGTKREEDWVPGSKIPVDRSRGAGQEGISISSHLGPPEIHLKRTG